MKWILVDKRAEKKGFLTRKEGEHDETVE